MTKAINLAERYCITPRQTAAEFPGRGAGPFPKGAVESAPLREPQLQRDIHDATIRMTQVTDGQVASQLILDALVGRSFFMQPPAHGGGRHIEFGGDPLELRYVARQLLPQAATDARAQTAAVLVLHQNALRGGPEEFLDRPFVLHDRQLEVIRGKCDRRARP